MRKLGIDRKLERLEHFAQRDAERLKCYDRIGLSPNMVLDKVSKACITTIT